MGAYYEEDPNYRTNTNCPCANTSITWPHMVPSFVNNSYFCETANPGPGTDRTWMILCGMARGVVAVAAAASSTCLLGFLRLCLRQRVTTWNLETVTETEHTMKIK